MLLLLGAEGLPRAVFVVFVLRLPRVQLRQEEYFAATMTVFVNGRVTFRCVRLSASEIALVLYGKFVYRAQRRLPMSFYREAMARF